ncbi:hypothetical protein ACWENR_19245 [Micromonospora sp. NPDC004336]
MTQPNDPTQALPTHWLPVDGAPTARLDNLPHLAEQAVHLTSGEPTARLHVGEATAFLGSGESTARLTAGEPTADLFAGEPTADLNAGGPTGRVFSGEPTARRDVGGIVGGRAGSWTTGQPGRDRGTLPATATGQVTGEASGTLFGGRTGASPVPPGAEVRFGPGVPTTPPAAPAWPATPPPRRRRSALRTVTSVLSTLLTVALLAAVGFYVWQRISPLEVTGVAVTVPRPAGDRCDVTVDVVATVSTNGRAGEIRYQWLRTGSAPGSLMTERVGRGQRSVHLTLRWAFTGVGTTTETATVNIVSPSAAQAQAPVAYDCRRG